MQKSALKTYIGLEASDTMDKKKFDKIMDAWAAHEMKAAPDLKPSPEVYQKLEDGVKRTKVSFFSWPVRLAAAGIAAALIILVIVMQPPKEMVSIQALREGTVAGRESKGESRDKMQVLGEAETEEKREDVAEPEKAKRIEKAEEGKKEERAKVTEYDATPAKTKVAEKKEEPKLTDKETLAQPKEVVPRARMEMKAVKEEVAIVAGRSQVAAAPPAISERIEFQFQPKGTGSIQGLDISLPQDEIISLSSEDNYRLILQLPQESYVYILQVRADKQLIRLFPNTEYNPERNPLQAGKTILIPSSPGWLNMEKGGGEVLIYVVTSAEPLQDWDDIDEKIAAGWLDQMEKDKQGLEDQVSVRVFKFNVHGPY